MIYKQTERILNEIRNYDVTLADHCLRTGMYTRRFMNFLAYTPDEIDKGVNAALVHDIGKTKVPLSVLNKPGKLTPEEKIIVDEHTKDIASIAPDLDTYSLFVAEHHHDNYKDIDTITQIIAVCDTYCALREKRSYKDALIPVEALSIMKNSERNGNLNILLVLAFEKMLFQKNLILA